VALLRGQWRVFAACVSHAGNEDQEIRSGQKRKKIFEMTGYVHRKKATQCVTRVLNGAWDLLR